MQYADDAIVITSNMKSMQQLMRLFESWCSWFESWCSWAAMEIRLDKCIAFGMQKKNGVYAQYQPSLNITGEPIPPLPLGEDFTYLGRMFNCNMNCTSAKSKVECKLDNMLRITNGIQLRVQDKLQIVTRYIHSQVLFELKANDFSLTWVEQTLDANCFRFIGDQRYYKPR